MTVPLHPICEFLALLLLQGLLFQLFLLSDSVLFFVTGTIDKPPPQDPSNTRDSEERKSFVKKGNAEQPEHQKTTPSIRRCRTRMPFIFPVGSVYESFAHELVEGDVVSGLKDKL